MSQTILGHSASAFLSVTGRRPKAMQYWWPEKLRAPLKVHGGKSYLVRRILQRAPASYDVLIDVFGGGGSVTLNAPQPVEVYYNDADWRKVGVLQCVQQPSSFSALLDRLRAVTYDEATFTAAHKADEARGVGPLPESASDEDRVAATADFIIRNRFSRGGLGEDFAYSQRLRGGQPGDINAWQTFVELLPDLHARLQHQVTLTCGDGIALLGTMRAALPVGCRPLCYLDPPYPKVTRSVHNAYGRFEMSDAQHQTLLQSCLAMSSWADVAISGYRNAMYDQMLSGWRRDDIRMPNHSGQGKKKQPRIECLWMSY